MQQVLNVFVSGLNKDSNPLSVDNKTLTDALNATTITFHGNEGLLQNDLGNTNLTYYPKVYNSEDDTNTDSKLCELVSLPKGYIPIGMKEFGDIIYIISHNPIENKTEIGSFPGPDFDLPSVNPEKVNINDPIYISGTEENKIFSSQIKELKTSEKLQVGDIITLKFNSNNINYLSNNKEAKLFKLKFLNTNSNEDITDKLNLEFTEAGEIQFHYPNIESGFLGAQIQLEKSPLIIYDGYKQLTKDGIYRTIEFYPIKVISHNYIKITSFTVKYSIQNYTEGKGATIEHPTHVIKVKNGEAILPEAIIQLPNSNFNKALFLMEIIANIEYLDSNNQTCVYIDDSSIKPIPIMHNIHNMYFEWDLRNDISMLDYEDILLTEFEEIDSSYENIVLSRNVSYEINNFLLPKFNISSLNLGEKIYYFERKNLKKRDSFLPKVKFIRTTPNSTTSSDCLNTILLINNNKFRDVANTEGTAAILWDTININVKNTFSYTYPNSNTTIEFSKYHTATLNLNGSIIPEKQQYIKTNLLGDLDNIFINNSKLVYPESKSNIGIITYPGGPSSSDPSNKDYDRIKITGEIGSWTEGSTRLSYGKVALSVNGSIVAEEFHNIPIKEGAYNIGGEAQRDFSKVSSGIASFGKEIEAKVTPYLTNGKTVNLTFNPSDFGYPQFTPIIITPIQPPGGEEWLPAGTYSTPRKAVRYKEKADAMCWRSINYSLAAESYTPDYMHGSEDTEGAGANGLLVYPSIGGFTTETEMKPLTMEWYLDLEAAKIKLPEDQKIQIRYTIPYKYKDGSYYKCALIELGQNGLKGVTNPLQNQNDLHPARCLFLYNGVIVSSQLTHNTILYDEYLSNTQYKLYNIPNSRYYTFACYSLYKSHLIKVDNEACLSGIIHPNVYTINGESYHIHIYLLDSSKGDFKFHINNKIIINPIIYISNIYKKQNDTYYSIYKLENINLQNNDFLWSDKDLMYIEKLEIFTKYNTGYYFDLGEDDNIKTSEDLLTLSENYIYNKYFPDPIYNIKEVVYTINE